MESESLEQNNYIMSLQSKEKKLPTFQGQIFPDEDVIALLCGLIDFKSWAWRKEQDWILYFCQRQASTRSLWRFMSLKNFGDSKKKYLRNLKKTKKIVSPKFPYSAQLLRSKFDFGLNNMILEVLLIVPIQKFNKA